jgi:cytidylate kinase
MNLALFLERTDSYVNAQSRDSRAPWAARRVTGPFITLSREAGSGGASLARLLARKLNAGAPDDDWRIYEGNLTTRMLHDNQLPARFARYLPEDKVPEINASIGELVGLHPSLLELVKKTNETMQQLATRGHAILVGRGANFATKDVAGGVHVRLIAPAADRARYLAQLYNISETEALARNAKCDAARRRYVKATFDTDVGDATAYDLVINTAQVSATEAAELIAAHVRLRTPAAD